MIPKVLRRSHVKRVIRVGIFPVFLLAGGILLAEPSVYGHSYSAGSAQVKRNSNLIYTLKQKIARQQEEIDGLKSLIESLSQQVNRLSSAGKRSSSGTSEGESKKIRALENRIARLEKRFAESSASTSRGTSRRRVKKGSSSTSAKVKSSRPATTRTLKSTQTGKSSVSSSLEKAASNKLFSRGVRLINQKRYSEAKLRFDILLKRNYKPASCNFYEGEIAYRTGHYDDAIKYYQKSVELNESAAYMDRLLLHTAFALRKSGEKTQARNFFQAIVDGYPGTASARVAKKYLK